METEQTNVDLRDIKVGLEALEGVESTAVYSIISLKNVKLISDELTTIAKISEPSKEYTEKYQPLVNALMTEHCDKDKKGNPIAERRTDGSTTYHFSGENLKAFNDAVNKLEEDEELKKLVEAQKKKIIKYNEAMLEKSALELIPIPVDELPTPLTTAQRKPIFSLIEV